MSLIISKMNIVMIFLNILKKLYNSFMDNENKIFAKFEKLLDAKVKKANLIKDSI